MPEGALIELPGVVGHVPSALRRKKSEWWVVAYTEYTACAAAFILCAVYDSLVLWCVPDQMIAMRRLLDLTFVLGNKSNVKEL